MVKYDSKEEFEERSRQNLHTSSKRSEVNIGGLINLGRSTDEEDKNEFSDSSSDEDLSDNEYGSEHEDELAEQVANLVYDSSRD